MIICPVCKTFNHHLSIICIQCGGYIQAKIENIDLFQKLWQLVEHPAKAFKQIAIAKHKNYIFILTALFGISYLFLLFEYFNIGRLIDKAFYIAIAGIGGGIAIGFVTIVTLTSITLLISKLFKSPPTKFLNLFSVITYSTIPIIYILIFLLPVKLSTFGLILYTSNPSPMVVNASVLYISRSLEALMVTWFILLFIVGIKIIFEINLLKATILALVSLIPFGLGIVFMSSYINSLIIYPK